jgi:hypothetical protein
MNFLSKTSDDRDHGSSAQLHKSCLCGPESPCTELLREKERMLQELRLRFDILNSLHQDILKLLVDLKSKETVQGLVLPSLDFLNEIIDKEVAKYIPDRIKQTGLVTSIMWQLKTVSANFRGPERLETPIPPIMKSGNLKKTQEGTDPLQSVKAGSFYFSRFHQIMEKTKATKRLQKKGSNASNDQGHRRQMSSKDTSMQRASDKGNSSKVSLNDGWKCGVKHDGSNSELLFDQKELKILDYLTEEGK